ncbi:DUF1963 domain-containing protein [Paenibacillus sp. FSL M7-1455]|uniref:DUF1963 domain-containing protein n=1 Tax=Paenibacillus sp. FSL M7-1455 TaxID=2975316 RepID=UPI004040ABE3
MREKERIQLADSGVGNFFIRREDLARLDFSNAYYTRDCLQSWVTALDIRT